jgi:hypothetical protein
MKLVFAALALTASLSACAPGPNPPMGGGTPRAGARDISNAGGSSQGMPQSPNSLPPGDRVNAPLTPATGAIGTTRLR